MDGTKRPPKKLKAKLSREDVHDILQGMQDLHDGLANSRFIAEHLCTEAPAGNALRAIVLEVYRPSATWQKSKTKEKQGEHRSILLIVFDKITNRQTEQIRSPQSKAVGQLGRNRTIWYNGDIKKKPAPTVRPECSKHISGIIS